MKRVIIISMLIVSGLVFFFMPKDEKAPRQGGVVAVGQKAPDFELPELDAGGKGISRTWRLSELKGKVVFINFWASWCDECKIEKPAMQMLYEKMQGKSFQMLTIVYRDAPEKAMAYMREKGFTIPVLFDAANEVGRMYRVTGVPETFILDKEGVVREKVIGRRQWDSPEAAGIIEKWLK